MADKKRFNTVLDGDLIDWLKIQAIKQHCDPCDILTELIREAQEKEEVK